MSTGGDRQTVTSIDCICADGTVLPPMIIMKGKYVQKSWIENSPLPPGTRWAASPSGWTDNELGVNYIKAFDEWTAEKGYVISYNYDTRLREMNTESMDNGGV